MCCSGRIIISLRGQGKINILSEPGFGGILMINGINSQFILAEMQRWRESIGC
jgi:hypothetical protein